MIVPMNTRTTPASPGIMTKDVVSFGLYKTVTRGRAGGAVVAGPVVSGLAACGPSRARAERAACAANSWVPSTSTAGRPAPVTTETAARPSRSWSAAQVRPRARSELTTVKGLGSSRPTAAASGPAAATGMDDTSKLAAYPSTTSRMTGITIIIASVRRSRRIWRNSLMIIAHMAVPPG
jgi:hypothetical protein